MFIRSKNLFSRAFGAVSTDYPSYMNYYSRSLSSYASHPTIRFDVTPYIDGPSVTKNYVVRNQAAIHAAREDLKQRLGAKKPLDLPTFVDVLFDFDRFSSLIEKIDLQAQKIMSQKYPQLLPSLKEAIARKEPASLKAFLGKDFLPAFRGIVRELTEHYLFNPNYIESIGEILTDDDFMDYIEQGRLVLDIGEDGHGPLPHMIAAFVMAELQREGSISSAVELYKSLSERSYNEYCPVRANFKHRFSLLLDSSYPYAMFSNPSSFSNHMLFQSDVLRILTGICKNHSRILAAAAAQDWERLGCKREHIMGRVMDADKHFRI